MENRDSESPTEINEKFDPIALGLKVFNEGEVQFYSFPPEEYSESGGTALTKSMPVFYNPVMVINRDITLIGYRAYQQLYPSKIAERPLRICDLMAASGIRAIRLLKFLPPPIEVVMNDLNAGALRLIKENLSLNQITQNYQLNLDEGIFFLEKSRNQIQFFDIMDIDPFGTPNVFVESALKATRVGGMMGVTATDTPVLFGIKPGACIRKYNTRGLRCTFLKEVGIRILLYFIASRAHPHMLAMEPLASFSSEHFVRVFVRVLKGKEAIDDNISHFGYIFWCPACDYHGSHHLDLRDASFICPLCGKKMDYGGPLWIGDLHNQTYINTCKSILEQNEKKTLPSQTRLLKLLDFMVHENQFPLGYYDMHKLCDRLNVSAVSMASIISEIEKAGFTAFRTHFEPNALKTTISLPLLKEILIRLGTQSKKQPNSTAPN